VTRNERETSEGVGRLILNILILAAAVLLVLAVLVIPILVGLFVMDKWEKTILGYTIIIVGYVLMFSAVFVIQTSELTGTGEIVGMEYVPAHNETSVRTQPTIIDGKTSIITLPSNEYKEEAYVIHVRQKTDSKYKRYMIEVTQEDFENFELGEEINLSEYKKYD